MLCTCISAGRGSQAADLAPSLLKRKGRDLALTDIIEAKHGKRMRLYRSFVVVNELLEKATASILTLRRMRPSSTQRWRCSPTEDQIYPFPQNWPLLRAM